MNCFFHSTHHAHARCGGCDRALCAACDHRIKGQPYCQECLVAGVDMLRRQQYAPPPPQPHAKSPLTATLFALIPGLGAAYNGQHVKALFHFLAPVGLWQLADLLSRPLEVPLFLAGAAFYLFTLYDAYHAAQRQREGADLQLEDERLKHQLQARLHLLGGLLIGTGLLSLFNLYRPYLVHRFWPLFLVAGGLYLLRDFVSRREPPRAVAPWPPQPMSAINAPYERPDNEPLGLEGRVEKWR